MTTAGVVAALRGIDVLRLAAVAGMVVAVLAAFWSVLFTTVAGWNNGCGDDGIRYCRMAIGHVEAIPVSRRILFPALLGFLEPPDPALRDGANLDRLPGVARGLNLAFLGCVCAEAAWLTRRVCRTLDVSRDRCRSAVLLALALVLLAPFAFRWTYFYPVLTDPLSTTLGLGWFLLATSSGRGRWLAVPVGLLAGLTREEWIFIIPFATAVQLLVTRTRLQLLLTVATAVATMIAAEIVFHSAQSGDDYGGDFVQFARHIVFDFFIGDERGRELLVWMTLFGLGLLPLLLPTLAAGIRRLVMADVRQRRGLFLVAAAVAALVIASAPLGYDVHRSLSLLIPFLIPFAVALAAASPGSDLEVAAIVAGTILVWRPFHTLDGSKQGYLDFWELFAVPKSVLDDRFRSDLKLVAVPCGIWLCLLLIRKSRAGIRRFTSP